VPAQTIQDSKRTTNELPTRGGAADYKILNHDASASVESDIDLHIVAREEKAGVRVPSLVARARLTL
jgi:hypothetical protein